METELITISDYCTNYGVEPTFIIALEEAGLIALTTIGEDKFLHFGQLVEMERYIHFHYDLEIDINGIEAILNLLHKVKQMQQEIKVLKNHINLHEPKA